MSSHHPGPDPVAPAIVALVEVFGENPGALCFPGVDHASLVGDVDGVREAAATLARCEQALAEARAEMERCNQTLKARATRGLAYAQIYAEDDETLAEKLATIELTPKRSNTRRPAKKAPRRTGRTRRAKATETDESVTELPFTPSDTTTEAAHADVA